MTQYSLSKRVLALVAGLIVVAYRSAAAQDTTETGRATLDTTAPGALDTLRADSSSVRDTTDTSGVQNPPGYRGMERDTSLVPSSTSPGMSHDSAHVGETTPKTEDSAEPRIEPNEGPAGGDAPGSTPQ